MQLMRVLQAPVPEEDIVSGPSKPPSASTLQGVYPTVSVGALADHADGFKYGGLFKMRESIQREIGKRVRSVAAYNVICC